MGPVNGHVAGVSRVIDDVNFIDNKFMSCLFGDAGKHVLKVAQRLILVAEQSRAGEALDHLGGLNAR
jgi:hypothetical protein